MTSPRNEAWLLRRLERSFLVGGVALLAACGKTSVAGSSGSCCSETEWTASAEVANLYAARDAGDTLGCPNKIDHHDTDPKVLTGDASLGDAGEPPWGTHDLLEPSTRTLRARGDRSCVYQDIRCCPGGRPLYEANEAAPVFASRARGGRWSKTAIAPLGASLASATRAAVARGWLDDAFAEHASVASFARATLELLAVGAPPSLLAAHQRAGIQEIRHAERCFALARAYGGNAIDPGALTVPMPRAGNLRRLACDLLVEGCIAETIGALLASRALEGCTIAPAHDTLRVIAADEAAHAALAWRTLAWVLKEGGSEAVHAVLERGQAEHLRLPPPAPSTSTADDVDLRAHGRLAEADMVHATRDAWRLVVLPFLGKLIA